MVLQLSKLTIAGIKSIKFCEIPLDRLNMLVGANGSGKSNLIAAFRLLQKALEGDKVLDEYVRNQGGADSILHYGRKRTLEAKVSLEWLSESGYAYGATFKSNQQNRLDCDLKCDTTLLADGSYPNVQKEMLFIPEVFDRFEKFIEKVAIYHANDTTSESKLKTTASITDTLRLNNSFSNLPAFLYMLEHDYPKHYDAIVKAIQRVAPFFHRFDLQPEKNYIRLRWKNIYSEDSFDVSDLSDGTLRFIALATVLLQPDATLPSLILLDEPELGLHPFAIQLLAGMMQSCSARTQIIAATQSVTLLNQFTWRDLIIADYLDGASVFRRFNEEDTKKWVEDYSLGELWEHNWLGGTPGWRA